MSVHHDSDNYITIIATLVIFIELLEFADSYQFNLIPDLESRLQIALVATVNLTIVNVYLVIPECIDHPRLVYPPIVTTPNVN